MTENEYVWVSNKQTMIMMLGIAAHLEAGEELGIDATQLLELCKLLDAMFIRCINTKELAGAEGMPMG